MSGTVLAQDAGVSQATISLIERGLLAPSLATLYRVARALDVSPAELLARSSVTGAHLVRSGHGVALRADDRDESQIAHLLTSQASSLELEAYLFDYPAGGQPTETFAHAGEDFVFVLEGSVDVGVGDRRYPLGAGDSLHYGATIEHEWNVGAAGVRLLLIVRTPRGTT